KKKFIFNYRSMKLKMDVSAASNSYFYQWYNPATGKLTETVSLKGSAFLTFSCPESYPESREYKDWVLYIHKE
ncbi:MAG TPA: putative collagen-binding domain-containing protein, partial [Bacteroidales bacterium]|nr:putative collagen-binding domain-containing protein [Bacteroidales bacterium]